MNRDQHRTELQAIQRRYETKYFPLVKAAIQSKIDEVKAIVKDQSVQSAISHLNKEVANTKVAEVIQTMALEVGLQFARRQWRIFIAQKRNSGMRLVREPGKSTTSVSTEKMQSGAAAYQSKGFGFNDEWVAWIKNFLFQFIVEKISFSVFETTKDVLFTVLNKAINEGWGVAETVRALDELPLSASQAARIVRTEITRATNAGTAAAAETFPFQQQKEWISAHDTRVRGTDPEDHASHRGLDGQVVDYEDVFRDPRNGDELRWPGDPEALAESTVNCRCSMGVTAKVDENGRLIPKRQTTTVIYPTNRRRTIITI